MFGRAWRIGSIGGVAIRVDTSWAFIAIFFTYSFWLRFTNPVYAISDGQALAVAVSTSVLFFGSVLVHELAHAGMARARRIPVEGITLFMFGGATSARLEDRGPADEFLVTVVGPLSSFGLSVAFWAVSQTLDGAMHDVFRYLAGVNLVLSIFNLVPGFPLDGGRLLRAVIWRVSGDLWRATRVAAACGQVVGVGLLGLGAYELAFGDTVAAVWSAMIGWMLFQAARGSVRGQRIRGALAQGVVRDAMRPPPPVIPATMSLSEALDRFLRGHEEELFPVVDGDRVVGVLNFQSAGRIGRDDPLRPARDAMLPLSGAPTVAVEERMDRASDRLSDGEAMVLDDGRLVGTISLADVERWLRTLRT